jgi:hypothetical protein
MMMMMMMMIMVMCISNQMDTRQTLIRRGECRSMGLLSAAPVYRWLQRATIPTVENNTGMEDLPLNSRRDESQWRHIRTSQKFSENSRLVSLVDADNLRAQ